MIKPPSIRLAPEEKLDLLRQLDRYREWESLDERRLCLECGKTITGRQIEVCVGQTALEPLRVSCPTEGCTSVPMDWSRPEYLNADADDSLPNARDSEDPSTGEEDSPPPSLEAEAIAHRILYKAYRALSTARSKTNLTPRFGG